jgi:hypothetical protein
MAVETGLDSCAVFRATIDLDSVEAQQSFERGVALKEGSKETWGIPTEVKEAGSTRTSRPAPVRSIASEEIGCAADRLETAWGQGVLAAVLNDKISGEWRVAPLSQWGKDQPFRSGNWGGSCNVVPKQSKHLKAAILFSVWLNTAKEPVLSTWNNYGIFPAALAGVTSPDLNQPDKNPSKFCGEQNLAEVYYQASKAVNADFAWAPWFAFVNDNYNKQIKALLGGKAAFGCRKGRPGVEGPAKGRRLVWTCWLRSF